MKLTKEQKEIIFDLNDFNKIKIKAFAGTGKTSILVELAKTYSNKKFIYLAFNKSIADEAKSRFPSNVSVFTTHGLAFTLTKDILKLNGNLVNSYRLGELGEILNIKSFPMVKNINMFFESFCNSNIKKLDIESLRGLLKTDESLRNNFFLSMSTLTPRGINRGGDPKKIEKRKKGLEEDILKEVLKGCKLFWQKMANHEIKKIHSFYFKFFELNSEELTKKLNYGVVMLDEAQDSNRATLNIFNNLKGKKVLVGDSHQNIYGFRGSNNIMDLFKAEKEDYLSTSFRFNSGVSKIANSILGSYKFEKELIKSIHKGECSADFSNVIHSDKNIELKDKAIITRTNAQIIKQFDKELKRGEYNINFVRNPEEIFSIPRSLYNLKRYFETYNKFYQKLINDKWLLNFKSIEEVVLFAEETNDFGLNTALKLIEEDIDIDNLYLKAIDCNNKEGHIKGRKDLYLTNAHTSKGLEWDEVYVTNDFNDFPSLFTNNDCGSYKSYQVACQNNEPKSFEISQEMNLLYVAVTRAKHKLNIGTENIKYLKVGGIEALDNDIKRDFAIKFAQKKIEKKGPTEKVSKIMKGFGF